MVGKRIYISIRSADGVSGALEVAKTFSPNIEIVDDRTVLFDISGKEAARFEEITRGIHGKLPDGRVAATDNIFSSLLLVEFIEGVSFFEDLRRLPVESLFENKRFAALMHDWGIFDLGSFADLPRDELVSRFGALATENLKKITGKHFRGGKWNVKENEYRWEQNFEKEITNLEPLMFVLSAGIRQIFARLNNVGLSTQKAEITLFSRRAEKRYEIKTVFPTRNEKLWLKQIILGLEKDLPEDDISRVALVFEPSKPRSIQSDLFSGFQAEPANLGLVASKIQKLVGDENLGIPQILDTWRPKPFSLIEDLSVLTEISGEIVPDRAEIVPVFYYRRVPVSVVFANGGPATLFMQGRRFQVKGFGGPWRLSSNWFEDAQKRDEWDIEIDTGAVYRVVLSKGGEGFIEGGYD
jgi:protein ImuB